MTGDPDMLYNAFALQITRWFQMRGKTDPLAGVNVREEYELVRQKKSMLSSFKRRMVVARYERFIDQQIAHPKTEEVSDDPA